MCVFRRGVSFYSQAVYYLYSHWVALLLSSIHSIILTILLQTAAVVFCCLYLVIFRIVVPHHETHTYLGG